MNSRILKNHTLATTALVPLALGLVTIATPSFAQVVTEQAQAPTTSTVPGTTQGPESANNASENSQGPSGEAIVVTGSRIARTDLTSAAPIAVISQEEFKLSGAVNVEDVINELPSVVPATTAFSNNPGGGVATLNLRNLGPQRTLVLVNGRRYMFFDQSQEVDLNTIPTFLIDNVETVTGGASAVYGSDAIGGVVNFKLRNLKGFEMGTQYGITQDGDGMRWDTHLALGGEFADGRGHATVYSDYYQRNPITQGDRPYTYNAFLDTGAVANQYGFFNGGSPTGNMGRFYSATYGTGTNFAGKAATGFTGLGATFNTPGAASRQFTLADYYNYAPANYLQVPDKRWLVGGYGDYEISDHVTAYTEVTYVNNRVTQSLAPTPVTGSFTFNLANQRQYLSAADFATLQTISAREIAAGATTAGNVVLSVARRTNEVGNRVNTDERSAFRTVFGFKGDITDKLHYDTYYMYARTRDGDVQTGNVSRSAIQAGLLSGTVDLFGPNSLSAAGVQAISILAQNQTTSTLQVANATIDGSLFNLGMGGDDVGFAVGAEYRSVDARFIPDTALSSGDVIGFNAGKATAGGYHVVEQYAELNVPLIANKPFVKLLELHGAGRYSQYSTNGVGNVWTYAGDVKWAPVKDITFRAQYQHAVRAPNVGELFGGLSQNFPTATDPCASAAAAAAGGLRNTCIATGVPAALVGQAGLQPATQIQSNVGGNPNLSAERSNSYTFGAVFSPSFVPRFHLTADYFNIKVKNAISTLGGGVNNVLAACYNVIQNASSIYCQAIVRDPANGQIDGATGPGGVQYVVNDLNANVAAFKTSGVDVGADYSQPLNFGLLGETSKLNASFDATWTRKNTTLINLGVGTQTIECAGKFGLTCGEPQAKFKWEGRLSYLDGGMTVSVAWHHMGKVRDDNDSVVYTVEKIKAYNTFDAAVAYDVNDNYNFTIGMRNMLDKRPPLVGTNQQQANGYPSTYDYLGRNFFVSATAKF